MKVTIFGSGYVGLVTSACLAETGNEVVCVDGDDERGLMLNRGQVPILEPSLQDMVSRNLASGRIRFTTDVREGVKHSLFQFICISPSLPDNDAADLTEIIDVVRKIGLLMTEYRLVVVKSAVPVGTCDVIKATLQDELRKRELDLEIDVCANPEFLKEGAAVNDFMKPDRIIVGSDNPRTSELLRTLYEPFMRNRDRLVQMGIRSAELTKFAANAMLATKISFMNELAGLAERVGADIEHLRLGIGADPRIGYHFIYPGCGYGGSCFPQDVDALVKHANESGYDAKIMHAVAATNERQRNLLFDKISQYFDDDLDGKTLAVWGLAFKPNTDGMHDAPSRVLIDALLAAGARVRGYDPVAGDKAESMYVDDAGFTRCATRDSALDGADALCVVTEWAEFRNPDFEAMKQSLRAALIFDGRNIYDPEQLHMAGFEYYAIGRGKSMFRSK